MKSIIIDGVKYVPESFYATEFFKRDKGEVVVIDGVMPCYFRGGDFLELRLRGDRNSLEMPFTKFKPGQRIRIIIEND